MSEICADCDQEIWTGGRSAGYGLFWDAGERRTICPDCCAVRERQQMDETGKAILYLCRNTDGQWRVTNYLGTLVYPVQTFRKGRHNVAGTRYDVWFRDHAGRIWHGVQYGEWTELTHCKRITRPE